LSVSEAASSSSPGTSPNVPSRYGSSSESSNALESSLRRISSYSLSQRQFLRVSLKYERRTPARVESACEQTEDAPLGVLLFWQIARLVFLGTELRVSELKQHRPPTRTSKGMKAHISGRSGRSARLCVMPILRSARFSFLVCAAPSSASRWSR
jgi:hypothetical protein